MERELDKDGKRLLLKQSGIPDWVIPTTLVKEKQPDLRSFFASQAYVADTGLWRGVYIHPKRPAADVQARKVFYLAAKEAALYRLQVYVTSLPRLVMALCEEEDAEVSDLSAVERVKTLWVTGFYEQGAPFPLTPWQAARLRGWVLDRYESGRPVSWLADRPLAETTAWWSGSFISMLQEHTVSFSVEGK